MQTRLAWLTDSNKMTKPNVEVVAVSVWIATYNRETYLSKPTAMRPHRLIGWLRRKKAFTNSVSSGQTRIQSAYEVAAN